MFKKAAKPIQDPKDFTESFTKLVSQLFMSLSKAKDSKEAEEPLGMLAHMADFPLPQAKTMYALALLMDGKPWFDGKAGMDWLHKGADEALHFEHDASFSMYQYGRILLEGVKGVAKDPITAKYWIDKAAEAGYQEAIDLRNQRWNL